MRHNLKFEDFNEWKSENFSFYDYIYQTLKIKKVSTDIFFAFSELFWPHFLIYENNIFLEEKFSKKYFDELLENKEDNLEYWMNMLMIDPYFENDADGEEKAEVFSKILVKIWTLKLSTEFPDLRITVTYLKDNETGDCGLTFFQQK